MPKNTLFNYFGKSPSAPKCKGTSRKDSVEVNNGVEKERKLNKNVSYKHGDIVWAKRDGNLWWPALVWSDENAKIETDEQVHIHFISRSPIKQWTPSNNICSFHGLYEGDDGSRFHSKEPGLLKACKLANDASTVLRDKRQQFILKSMKSDDKNEIDHKMDYKVENSALKVGKRKRSEQRREGVAVKKYRRIIESDSSASDDDDDDAEYKPENVTVNQRLPNISSSDEDYKDDDCSSVEEKPVKTGKKRKRSGPTALLTSPKSDVTEVKSKLQSFQVASSQPSSDGASQNAYLHETLDFLQAENIRDSDGNKPNSPAYDRSTLRVPSQFLQKQTPAMHQWWSIKSKHFDVILFFKVGKFYELYHMDAVVGVKELGLIYMKGNFAHAGFPELAFGRYSAALVQKGYSAARVEQTETPEQNAQRIKGKSLPKFEKTLRREICRITTKGTQIYNVWDEGSLHRHENNFLLAFNEQPIDRSSVSNDFSACRKMGVCFVDTSVGVFHLGKFYDDRYCSRFRTLISHYFPCQVLYEKGKLSAELSKIIRTGLASVIQTGLSSGSQFWDASKCLKMLSKERYFMKNDEEVWPDVLTQMKSDTDTLGLTPDPEHELTLSALGACVFYLKKCLIDFQVLSMRQFQLYVCEEQSVSKFATLKQSFPDSNQQMILDSSTLANLEILHNNRGSSEGTLLERLDRCKTAFGRRLLRQWLCSPPCHPDVINARLDAIDDLITNNEVMESLTAMISKIPDLERMLAQIHSMSKGSRNPDHPDTRAVLYEENKYSKKKINDFMSVLEHYELVHKNLKKFQDVFGGFKSSLLQKILCFESNETGFKGAFPDMERTLQQWRKAFDHKKAKETGKIIPTPGTNPEYDTATEDINAIQVEAENYLRQQKKIFACSTVSYKGSGNKRFQIEIPVDRISKRVPDEYEISGQRKGYKSFRTEFTVKLVKNIEEAETRKATAQADCMAIVFREFSKDYVMWKTAVHFLGQLDVLISLARYSKGSDGIMCRPCVLPPDSCDKPMLDIREGRHPCVTKTIYSDAFIPNDTTLGCSPDDLESDAATKSQCLLLTGPNMGGKSTLMRQVGLLVVLAQIGCYVPAQSCAFTACDRIFTRLGASDRIMAGESTFFVELSETCSILKHASENSLVLLDELGRGTSTYDGTAIACAVLQEVAENIGCRTIFSTHYRTLVDEASSFKNVQLGHMACMVEDENDNPVEEVLIFLYKLAAGACPKSYGFHAALLAGVPDDVVKLAHTKAAELEKNKKDTALFKKIYHQDIGDVRSLIQ